MDRETFSKMWEMSAPGTESENCFLRLPQTEYYAETKGDDNCLHTMPDVWCFFIVHFSRMNLA